MWTTLRLWRLRRSIDAYSPRVAKHRFGGVDLRVSLRDPLAAGWYDRDWETLSEIAELGRHRLRPGARVFNIGAHQGIVALMLHEAVSPGGHVVAIELSAHNARIAEENRLLNGVAGVTVVNAAVARVDGTITVNEGLNGQVDDGTGQWGLVTVPSISIDSLSHNYGQPDVLFIDIEGYEVEALRGASETLAARPDLFVEVHVNHGIENFGGTAEDVLNILRPLGYSFVVANETRKVFLSIEQSLEVLSDRFFLIAWTEQSAYRKKGKSEPGGPRREVVDRPRGVDVPAARRSE